MKNLIRVLPAAIVAVAALLVVGKAGAIPEYPGYRIAHSGGCTTVELQAGYVSRGIWRGGGLAGPRLITVCLRKESA